MYLEAAQFGAVFGLALGGAAAMGAGVVVGAGYATRALWLRARTTATRPVCTCPERP